MKEYKKRIADDILKRKLEGKGAVLIVGPKWCGKTTTAEQVAKSKIYIDEPSKVERNILFSETDPNQILKGDTPRLIDEWQLAPKLYGAIRYEVDHRDNLGQFILTGSAVPISSEYIKHSGVGRFSFITMRPMSLYESCESTGEVSLLDLFNGINNIAGTNNLDADKLSFLICRGGWPISIGMREEIALDQAFDYYDMVIQEDINRVDKEIKNIEKVKRFMRSYARNQGSCSPNTVIAFDINQKESALNDETVSRYVNALTKIFVIEEMPARNPNLRSKTAIRTSNTRYFVDPSIAAASLGIGPNDLINDFNTFGFLFETLAVRDLRVYADSLFGNIYHYRDKDDLECDVVIHLRNGNYGLVEIKLGGSKLIEEGATNLLKLKNKLDTTKMKEPSFLMVLVGLGDYAYRREDGIYVVPLGCLKN